MRSKKNIPISPTQLDPHPCVVAGSDAVRGVRFNSGQGSGVIGDDTPTKPPGQGLSLWCWVVMGGLWEDGFSGLEEGTMWGGRRAVNHFHDPLSSGGGGYTGLLDENSDEAVPYKNLLRRGISVTEWVMNGQSGSAIYGRNDWGYPTIGVGLHRAFTERTLELRERGMAAAFRAMGQMMHLIGDNTVPDHARDLAHPGDGFEEYMRDDPVARELFNHTPFSSWVTFPVRTLSMGGIRAFWDRDVYTTDPEITTSGVTPGLDEFTNANFLAWSHLKKAGLDLDFSTVPKEPGVGFRRTPRLGFNQAVTPFVYFRIDNLVSYPWPQLAPLTGDVFPSAPRTLPLPVLAQFDPSWSGGYSGPNVLGPKAWEQYALPLMARAHGYGQSVLSLALQPARAEVTPVFSDTDFMRLELRLWNLWPASSPHALTWSIDSVELVAIRPDGVVVPNGVEVSIKTTLSRDVAPGEVLQTTAAVTFGQYATLARSSHTALLVTAHLANTERTPLSFAVPIPNGYPLVKQVQTVDQTPLYTATVEDCCGLSCAKCGAQQVYRNPISQRVTGTIEVVPTRRDVFMKIPTREVAAAMKRDARVSAVQLLAWPQASATFANPMRVAATAATTLTLTNTTLQRFNNDFWARAKDAPDVEEGPLNFTVDLDPRDFYVSTGNPGADGARATGTIYLAVWMTSGALYLQRLVFWPMGPNVSASQVFRAEPTCSLTSAPRLELPEGRTSVCRSAQTGTTCTGGLRRQRPLTRSVERLGSTHHSVDADLRIAARHSLRRHRADASGRPAVDHSLHHEPATTALWWHRAGCMQRHRPGCGVLRQRARNRPWSLRSGGTAARCASNGRLRARVLRRAGAIPRGVRRRRPSNGTGFSAHVELSCAKTNTRRNAKNTGPSPSLATSAARYSPLKRSKSSLESRARYADNNPPCANSCSPSTEVWSCG
jgi:hypothetical protein